MSSIDKFLSFLFEHKNDDRISISKKIKFGFKHFYILFSIDESPDSQHSRVMYSDHVEIIIDNRNKCIEISYDHGHSNFIIEDEDIIEKWSNILDNFLSQDKDEKVKSIFENALNSCHNKNLYREYQMKKLFNN